MVARILHVKIISKYLCKVLASNWFFFIKGMIPDSTEYMDTHEITLPKHIKLQYRSPSSFTAIISSNFNESKNEIHTFF